MRPDQWHLGLDSSTQSLKAVVIDNALSVRHEYSVNFDTDLPGFKTEGGVYCDRDGLTVTAPPLMWVAALDILFQRMKKDRFPFANIASISGSGQQHGSVYLRRGARKMIRTLDARLALHEQLADLFSVDTSPIWMDSSTTAYCREREKKLGGAQAVAAITGSRAYERFTGNQIAKIARLKPEDYADTERIALVSSFVASLMIGDYAPIDVSDGSGMNLMSIKRRAWDRASLDVTAPGLQKKLGALTLSHKVIGPVATYYTTRYGFSRTCCVIAFSGDNPCSLAGLRLNQPGDVAISLGTSDTFFAILDTPRPSASEGHIFASPVNPRGYMALICYKNGSLTRERVRQSLGAGNWTAFNRLVQSTPPGNNGNIGFYIDVPEITPPLLKCGTCRFNPAGKSVKKFNPPVEARAVIESQFMSMYVHGTNVGIKPARILATGGASINLAIIRIMSDIFGVPVYTAEQSNSAALGAAYRARHGFICRQKKRFVPFMHVLEQAPPFTCVAQPDADAHARYTANMRRFTALEKRMLKDLS